MLKGPRGECKGHTRLRPAQECSEEVKERLMEGEKEGGEGEGVEMVPSPSSRVGRRGRIRGMHPKIAAI